MQDQLSPTIAIASVVLFSSVLVFTPDNFLSWPPAVEAHVGHVDQKNQENGSSPYSFKPNGSLPNASKAPTFGSEEDSFPPEDGRTSIREEYEEHLTQRDVDRCSSSLKKGAFCILYGPSSTFCECSSDDLEKLARKSEGCRRRRHHFDGKHVKDSMVSSVCDIKSAKWHHGIYMDNDVYRRCAMNDDVISDGSDEGDAVKEDDVVGSGDVDAIIRYGQLGTQKANLGNDGEKKMHSCNGSENVNDLKEEEVDMAARRNASELLNETDSIITNLSNIHRRQEIDGGLYNYASDAKGAKVLSSNKEAKGASNILNKDKDKYFWSPCNAENKYVELELSEETLVVEIVIANYEFYSSNVRDFELFGSSMYPIEEWTLLGKFEAENGRVAQHFTLSEPKWTRYLRVQIISYYGTDFYCTLTVLEVHGVDAIEWLLVEWFAEEEGYSTNGKAKLPSDLLNEDMASTEGDMIQSRVNMEEKKARHEHQQTSRLALDAVMKLMMQKIRSLEHNQPHIYQLKELDDQYTDILNLYMNESSMMKGKLEGVAIEISGINATLRMMERKRYEEKQGLETKLLNHIGMWNVELNVLRSEVKKAEDREIVALTVALLSVIFVVLVHTFKFCMASFKMTSAR